MLDTPASKVAIKEMMSLWLGFVAASNARLSHRFDQSVTSGAFVASYVVDRYDLMAFSELKLDSGEAMEW